MPVTRDEVISALQPDEPNYPAAAQHLGAEAAPILAELAEGDDVELATKAASLAGFLTAEAARPVLRRGVGHDDPAVRSAAAASLARQPELVDELSSQLLTDPDIGVRKWTLRSLQARRPKGFRDQVAELASKEQVPALRELAGEVARQLPP
jgi:HEAT repeat protein